MQVEADLEMQPLKREDREDREEEKREFIRISAFSSSRPSRFSGYDVWLVR